MALADSDVRRLISAAADRSLGQKMADSVNMSNDAAAFIDALIVATNVSTTIDFAGKLNVGDRVVILPATAGNAQFVTVATAGTLPQAAVVGSLYIVIRNKEAGY